MKKVLVLLLSMIMLSITFSAGAEEIVDQIINMRTTSAFSDKALDDVSVEKIVAAGLAAASARNLQPWHFAVVSDQDVMSRISGTGGGQPNADARQEGEGPAQRHESNGAPPARGARAGLGSSPVAIIVYTSTESMKADYAGGNTALFDCGLATQNMVLAANTLGYGAKIVAGPLDTLNGAEHDVLCELLNVDTGMSAVAVLLIGVPAETTVDAASGASVRADSDRKVSYIK